MNLFSTTKNLAILGNLEKKNYLKRIIQFIIGCFIVSVAYNVFIVDNKIVPGGVGGIAVIVNNLSGIANDSVIGNYRENTIMMKYNELMVKYNN